MDESAGKIRIHAGIKSTLLEKYPGYYYLIYSYVKNSETAAEVLEQVAYYSLKTGRKLDGFLSFHAWILQLAVKAGVRTMYKNERPRDFTSDSQLYAFFETLEPSAANVFKLFYFEGLNMEKIGEILSLSQKETQQRLAFVRSRLRIDSSLDPESMERLEELIRVYESPELPAGLEERLAEQIRREEADYEIALRKQKRNRILKPAGLVVLAGVIVAATAAAGRQNPVFAEAVLQVPLVNKLFAFLWG